MQRLLDDAEKFSGVDYDISNLNDVYEAIHVIQTEMGITGTTAREASETISGSIGMLSGAWTNLVAGFADKEADIPKLIDDVVDSAETAFNNLLPVTEQAITGLTQFVDNIAPTVVDRLPGLAEQVLPPLMNTAKTVVTTLAQSLPQLLEGSADIAPAIVSDIAKTAVQIAPDLARTGAKIVTALARGVADSAPEIVPAAKDAVFEVVDVLTEPEIVSALLDAGIDITIAIADGIIDGLVELDDNVPEIVDRVVDLIGEGGAKLLGAGATILHHLADGFRDEYPEFAAAVDGVADIVDEGIKPAFEGALEFLQGDFESGIEDVCKGVEGTVSSTLGIIDGLFDTHIQQWYNETTTFFEGLGRWAYETNADIYGLTAAQNEAARRNRASELENEIRQEFNQLIREGENAADAYNTALNNVVVGISDSNIFYDYLSDVFNPAQLEEWAQSVRQNMQYTREAYSIPTEAMRQMKGQEAVVIQTFETAEKQADASITSLERKSGQIVELSEKELAAQQKAAEKALKEQQKVEEKAQKERERAAEKAQKAQEKAEQAQTKALEKAISEREKLLTKYQSDIDKIYDNIDKLENDYADEVKNRTQDIFNSYSLFEEVPDRIQVSGADLTKNLEMQVERMKLFYSELDQLAAKGVDERLVENIRSQGVGALDNLDALLDLSDAEIENYNKLYMQKAEFASQQADKELESAKQTTIDAVADEYDKIDKLTAERSKTIGETFINGIAEGMKNGFGSLTEAATNAIFGGYASQSLINYSDTETGRAEIRRNKVSDTADTLFGAGGIVINVNGIQYQNPAELAAAMSVEIQKQIRREGKAYA